MTGTAVIVTMGDTIINMNVTLTPEKEMVLIKTVMDIEVTAEEMNVTMQLRRSRDHFNRIYRHGFRSNINKIAILGDSVDRVEHLVQYQAIIHLIGTILPAIIIQMIKKMSRSVSNNNTKRATTHTLKTATSNSSWANRRRCDDIHPMK